jgi:hypothetical protein
MCLVIKSKLLVMDILFVNSNIMRVALALSYLFHRVPQVQLGPNVVLKNLKHLRNI